MGPLPNTWAQKSSQDKLAELTVMTIPYITTNRKMGTLLNIQKERIQQVGANKKDRAQGFTLQWNKLS